MIERGKREPPDELEAVTFFIFLGEDELAECSKCEPPPVDYLREVERHLQALRSIKARLLAEQGRAPAGEWFYSPGEMHKGRKMTTA